MSWDSYIDNLIAQTKDASGTAHADKACIIGLDGGAPWTTAGHAMALKVGCNLLHLYFPFELTNRKELALISLNGRCVNTFLPPQLSKFQRIG